MKIKTKQLEDILAYIRIVKNCSGINIEEVDIKIKDLGNIEGAGLDTYSGENTFVTWVDKKGKENKCNVTASNIKHRMV